MKSLYKPALAAITLVFACGVAPTLAQGLPPTNMGKFVHQPGDNQYSNQTQAERHSPPPAPPQQQQAASGGGGPIPGGPMPWTPAPPPARPDVSLLPIVTDEPIPQPGFPPVPARIDLPIASAWGGVGHGGMSGGPGGPGGGGGYGAGGANGGRGLDMTTPTKAPGGYMHQQAGAYAPQRNSTGGYKAITPPAPTGGGDYYSSSAGGIVNPAIAGQQQLNALGKEPKLSDKNDAQTMPDAPTAVVVNQARTQDLSIPEDDYAQSKKLNNQSTGNRMKRQLGNSLMRPLLYGPQMAVGIGMGMGMSAVHY